MGDPDALRSSSTASTRLPIVRAAVTSAEVGAELGGDLAGGSDSCTQRDIHAAPPEAAHW